MRVEVAVPPLLSPRLVWLREAVMPAGDDRAKETVPENPLRLVRVMVDAPEVLARIVWGAGLAEIENSDTLTVIVVE